MIYIKLQNCYLVSATIILDFLNSSMIHSIISSPPALGAQDQGGERAALMSHSPEEFPNRPVPLQRQDLPRAPEGFLDRGGRGEADEPKRAIKVFGTSGWPK